MKQILKKFLLLNKKQGETPLETLEAFRAKNKKYKDVKMTYAGRLDPMASGLLLVLTGEETKQKEKYLKLSKEYKFSVLFGFATDTYDILGKVTSCARQDLAQEELKKEIQKNIKFFSGKFMQKYPMYSSRTVDGKPLFAYARAGESVKSPEHEVVVKSLKFLKIRKISTEKLLANIELRIEKIKGPARNAKHGVAGGDFRQKEILKIWRKELKSPKQAKDFFVGDFEIKCGSGTYVRGIANSLGEKMSISALAFSIKRTKVGKFASI